MMRVKHDKEYHQAFTLSDHGDNKPGMLTRNVTIEQNAVVRDIGECPLTLRASIDGWNNFDIQGDYFINKDGSPTQGDVLDYANTPRYQVITVRTSTESDAGVETVHNVEGIYDVLSHTASLEETHRPTISLGDLNKTLELETVLYRDLHDEKFRQVHQDSITTTRSYRFEQPRPVWHFVNAITSDDVHKQAEDWGIDRSIYTRYARSGFFADCHVADALHHGEYLNAQDCEAFADCRMPLIVCIIAANRETRLNEVQKSIVPLAVNILDRYIVKHKNSMARLVSIAYSHLDSGQGENGSKPVSLASSLSTRDFPALDALNIARGLKGKYTHDNLIKLCFKFSADDNFEIKKEAIDQMASACQDHLARVGDGDSCYEDDSCSELSYDNKESGLLLKFDVIYNFIAAACYFIADRYNGLTNTSVKALLYKWESNCHLLTKTRDAAKYIRDNRATALSIIMSFMFDIYFILEYKLTTPFPCHMVQDLILSTTEFGCSQNPAEHNTYQKVAAIMARIAYVDDSFHKFQPSIVALSIYSLIYRLAVHDGLLKDDKAWLLVDDSDPEIKNCCQLMATTVQQFVDTDVLDVLMQPVYMKHQRSELFSHVFEDLCDVEITKLSEFGNLLTSLC